MPRVRFTLPQSLPRCRTGSSAIPIPVHQHVDTVAACTPAYAGAGSA